ncbi:MAG: ArnT family glycosyltransferase [Anaerolineales bacterium]
MVIGVLLRLLAAIYQGNIVTDLPGIYDQISYDGLARRVVDGHGFSFGEDYWPATRAGEPTAHWSYAYTLYLAAIYKLFGFYPLIARIIQALIAGIFQTILTWRIGTRLFGRAAGLFAAALNAIYIYFFYYAGALLTETFYITGILWVFDASFRLVEANRDVSAAKDAARLFAWLELGLAIGLTVLLRQLFLLFLPFLFIYIWWNVHLLENHRWKQVLHWSALRGLFAVVIVLAFMILPFTVRNYKAFGTFVLLNTNAGFAFYWGNHPIHGTHFMPLLPEGGLSYRDLIPPELLSLNEGMLDKALLQEGIRIVLNDPIRYILLSLSRIEEYVKFWPSPDSGLLSNVSRVGSFGLLLPFMLYGMFISSAKLRKPIQPRQGSDLLIIYLFIIIYASIHILTWTLIRYRLPIDAILVLFAGLGLENLRKIRHKWTS